MGSRENLVAGAFCAFGWLSSFSYVFHLIGPHLHPCSEGNALPYLVSLFAGPTTLAMSALLLSVGAGFGVVVRWPCLLQLATAATAVMLLPGYLVDTTLEGHFICAANAAGGPTDFPSTAWQRAWVPVHNAAIVLFGGFLIWYWRRGSSSRSDA
jgi:hypothetical protein